MPEKTGILSKIGIGIWDAIANNDYDKYVTDPTTAPEEMRKYENFEEIFLSEIMNFIVNKKKKDTIFMEAGSGTGRYLVLFGRKIYSKRDKNFRIYLKKIIGIDFSGVMWKIAEQKLKSTMIDSSNLYDLLKKENKFVKIAEDILELDREKLLVHIGDRNAFEKSIKLVCCMFGTLGNIGGKDKEKTLKALKRMAEWASDNGILVISVFNRKYVETLGMEGYKKIKQLIGESRYDGEGNVISFPPRKGKKMLGNEFVSHWFTEEEVKEMAKTLKNYFEFVYIIRGDLLKPSGKNGIDTRRGFIIVSSTFELNLLAILRETSGLGVQTKETVEVIK